MENIIEQIAQKNGVSVEEVQEEMQLAIRMAMKNRDANEYSKKFWDELSPNDEEPSISEFCKHILFRS